MNLNITNKVFMVAGASSGLGLGIAHQLAAEGAKLSIASRTPDKIAQAAAAISSETSSEVRGYVFDARNQESIKHWVQATIHDFGHIDGIVINAGGPPPGSFDELDDKAWQSAFDLTMMGAVRLIRESLPALKVNGGSILTLTSSTIKEPVDYLTLSTVMRSGVASLAKSLADQLASDNIRINNLIPGSIQTDRMDALNQYVARRGNVTRDQAQANIEADIPMGRYGETEEFAKAATFLLSDAASYITGSSLAVDGGRMKSL